MSRVFTGDGESVPVTVVQVESNRIVQIKAPENDGYRAVQVTTGSRKAARVSKPLVGHYAKAGVESGRGLWEFRVESDEGADLSVGSDLQLDLFEEGQVVDVSGTSIGKGFAGAIKRHNFQAHDLTLCFHFYCWGNNHVGTLGTWNRTLDQKQIVFLVDTHNLKVLHGFTNRSHVTGHFLSLKHSPRGLTLANRTRRPVGNRVAVRHILSMEIMSLNSAGKPFTDTRSTDINHLPFFKKI
jgi:large subunit ribosomal protein L3